MRKPFLIGFAACAIVLTLCAAIVQNTFTTVTPGQFPSLLPAPAATTNWFVVIHADGDGTILESPKFAGVNTNLNWNGQFGADSGKFTNSLTLNGSPVLTNSTSGSAGSTNYRSAVLTLTTTGTNVNANQIDFALTNQCYRLTLTNNAFFGTAVCTNVPATNFFQWVQLDLVQDATGARLVQFDPTGWVSVNGAFAVTTNANAWDTATLINSRQTNGVVAFVPVNYLH